MSHQINDQVWEDLWQAVDEGRLDKAQAEGLSLSEAARFLGYNVDADWDDTLDDTEEYET